MEILDKLNLASTEVKIKGKGSIVLPEVAEDNVNYVVGVDSEGKANVDKISFFKDLKSTDPTLSGNSEFYKSVSIDKEEGNLRVVNKYYNELTGLITENIVCIDNDKIVVSTQDNESGNSVTQILPSGVASTGTGIFSCSILSRNVIVGSDLDDAGGPTGNVIIINPDGFSVGNVDNNEGASFIFDRSKTTTSSSTYTIATTEDIPDAYTKTESDGKYAEKSDLCELDYLPAVSSYCVGEKYVVSDPVCFSNCVYINCSITIPRNPNYGGGSSYTINFGDVELYECSGGLFTNYKGKLESIVRSNELQNKANKSTTLAGYGITDAYTKTESDAKYLYLLDNYRVCGLDSYGEIHFCSSSGGSVHLVPNYPLISISNGDNVTNYMNSGISYNRCNISFPSKSGTIALTSDIPDSYTKEEINANFAQKSDISKVYKYVGSVENYSDLPTSDLVEGYVYNIVNECTTENISCGDNVAWTGTEWDKLGGSVDLSNYVKKSSTEKQTLVGPIEIKPNLQNYPDSKSYVEFTLGGGANDISSGDSISDTVKLKLTSVNGWGLEDSFEIYGNGLFKKSKLNPVTESYVVNEIYMPNNSGVLALASDIPDAYTKTETYTQAEVNAFVENAVKEAVGESMTIPLSEFDVEQGSLSAIDGENVNNSDFTVYYKKITKNETSTTVDVLSEFPFVELFKEDSSSTLFGALGSSSILNKRVSANIFFTDILENETQTERYSTLVIVIDNSVDINNIIVHIKGIKYKTVLINNPGGGQ